MCVRKRGSTSWSKGRFNELMLQLEVTTAKADMPQGKEGRERERVGGVSNGGTENTPCARTCIYFPIQTFFVKGGF